jgi:hypothetical protein
MQLVKVTQPEQEKEFIRVNVELNKDNPAYIRPLDKDVMEVFDLKKIKLLGRGSVSLDIKRQRKKYRTHCRFCK